jgi:hypothetical protein
MPTTDIWTFTDEAPAYAERTSSLWHWSTNFDAGTGPFALYLDLIGWSDDVLGEPIYNLSTADLGYMELDRLADALKEYAERPTDVREWVDELMALDA